ncbi:hypothetical protein [Amycolatopsis sp. FDAARGOS 1241]|uniref:hypothetical protein n=1 Tax=Amycolatopsis sp. FDAARGOS 1241 TaxID=2778070 RepID=UPI00194F3118|nr:hypothetical protein [Amycolatopsis sp. FDAARGOS 1241]QRP49013.1 hypothetical protein I6J71_15150 [Amycolatopsis sp. FDAARGOS 1241]
MNGHAALSFAGDTAGTNVDTVDGGALVFVVAFVVAAALTVLGVATGSFAAGAEHPAAAAATKATAMSLLGKSMPRILPDLRGGPDLGVRSASVRLTSRMRRSEPLQLAQAAARQGSRGQKSCVSDR